MAGPGDIARRRGHGALASLGAVVGCNVKLIAQGAISGAEVDEFAGTGAVQVYDACACPSQTPGQVVQGGVPDAAPDEERRTPFDNAESVSKRAQNVDIFPFS
jgi:hypothetical protein